MACCPATITSAACCRQLAPVLTAMLLQAQVAEPVPESLAAVKHGAAATLPVVFFCTHENWWAEPKDFRAWGAGVAQGFHMKIKTKKLGLAVGQVRLEGILPVHPDLGADRGVAPWTEVPTKVCEPVVTVVLVAHGPRSPDLVNIGALRQACMPGGAGRRLLLMAGLASHAKHS